MTSVKGSLEALGVSAGIVAIRDQVTRLLRHPAARRVPPILILGETGTGKGHLARTIHDASLRAREPFVRVNCAAIPEPLVESELFGYARGAHSEARFPKPGLFHAAHRGTLFLDEIGAIPSTIQPKLLTAIEEQTIRRLGSVQEETVNVWIVAATSEDLPAAIRERRFREDLYQRLAGIPIHLPPLRERPDDIVLLAEGFLARACADHELPSKRLSEDARSALREYRWPGNVRELLMLMERVAVLVDGPIVTAADVGLVRVPSAAVASAASEEPGPSLRNTLEDVERAQLKAALEASDGNLSRAATLLGVPRNTLRYRLDRLGLRDAPGRPSASRAPLASDAATGGPRAPARSPGATRTVALLWVALGSLSASTSDQNRALDQIMEKILAFGGRLEELQPDRALAVFGLGSEPDPCGRATHAALAIQRGGERSDDDPVPRSATKIAIHLAECPVDQTREGSLLTPAAREHWMVLERLVRDISPNTIAASPAANVALHGRFTFSTVGGALLRPDAPAAVEATAGVSIIRGKPAIAVLPFRNLGDDPAQNYFGEGITEDIIGGLARFRWLLVIGRHSTLRYTQGQAEDARVATSRAAAREQISRDLGVRYLVDGSVRRSGVRLRVTADLTDADTGHTVWAERYDGELKDLFDFQDHITGRIVATLEVNLRLAESSRAFQKRPDSLDAYDCMLRALAHLSKFSRDEFLLAGELLRQAIALDPAFAPAYSWRAWWHLFLMGQGWSPNRAADAAEAGRMTEAALNLDPHDSLALATSAHLAALHYREYDKAVARYERSLALNPNSAFAWALSAVTYCYLGEPKVALERALYAMSLSPFDSFAFYMYGAASFARMLEGNYEDAVSWAQKARRENPRFTANLRRLAACLALAGRPEEARVAGREFLALEPHFTITAFLHDYALRDPAHLELYARGLRGAGLPE